MHTIVVSTTDLARLKVILLAMKKGKKWELEGEEILAFAQAFNWAAEMHEKINAALFEPEKTEPLKAEPVKPEIVKKGKR